MIVTSVQRIVSSMRDSFQTRVYKAIQDPVTMKVIKYHDEFAKTILEHHPTGQKETYRYVD